MSRTVVFVCPHGALKSRLAAALFNASAPTGWRATSAGLHPQESVSVHAAPLLAGTGAAELLDLDPPRALAEVGAADRLVPIDCETDAWWLADDGPTAAMRDELRRRVDGLIRELADDHT